MIKEDKLDVDLIKLSQEYWGKIIYKEYDKIILNQALMENKLNENKKKVKIHFKTFEKLIKISKNDDFKIYMIILSVFKTAIYRRFESKEFFTGIPQYLKSDDIKNNNKFIVLDNNIIPDDTFKEFLMNEGKELLEAYTHQFYPMKELYRVTNIYEKVNLYCCMRSIHNANQIQDILNLNNNELTLVIEKYNDCIELEFNYCDEVISDEVNRIISIFINILTCVIENTEVKLKDIEILSREEKKKLLVEFNDTAVKYPKDKTIHELFEEQVEKTPNNIAVVFEDKEITYKELNEKANSLARTLRESGVKEESIVGIMVESSIEMVVGMIAILKAGGAYLPIDPEYPDDRIKYMLNNSGAKILLSQEKQRARLMYEGEFIDIDNVNLYSKDMDNLGQISNSDNLAYVIYTSGTTGKPKGVMTEHGAISTTLQWRRAEYNTTQEDIVLPLVSNSFDGFITSFYTPIVSGAKVILLNNNQKHNIMLIKERIIKDGVTHLIAVPSLCSAIMDILDSKDEININIITVAGEALTSNLVSKCKNIKSNIEIVNEYGPTENSVISTIKRNVLADAKITIGNPISNTKIYILGKLNRIVPIGVSGEICISGDGLARGYLNRPELTAERFVDNPYEPGEKMYRTGDLARWLPDGNIEFLGRIDNQVKIRGFRIELGEIENQLLKNDEIKEVVAVDKEDNDGNKYLCAYIVSEREMPTPELRGYLSKVLPDYMIPSYFIQIEKMPLTPNGKVDRKALPKPDGDIVTGVEYVAPRNEVEEKLVKVWSEILGVEKIGINDDFFTLGGHSLKAIQVTSMIHKELNVEVPVSEVFSNPTIRQLGEYIASSRKSTYSSIKAVEEREVYKASSAQKRLFALNQFGKEEINYNVPAVMIVEGKLEKHKVEETFRKLVERHEAFRTSFELVNEEIVQRIHKEVDFNVEYEEISEVKEEIIKEMVDNFIRSFDLSKAPLLRVKLVGISEEKHILMVDMHHIVSDGTTMGILIEEFAKLYKGEELKPLRIQYKDYATWENELLESEDMKVQEEYWMKVFSDEIPVLNIPTDYTRPTMQSFEGDSIDFKVNKELAEKIRKIGDDNGATTYMILLSAYNILLSKYSGQEDIIVGSPIAGRNHADLEGIVGMFVNTLAMRNYPKGERTFEEFLQSVKENALKAYENQDYQFDELVEKIQVRKDLSRNPLFDTMFVLQNTNSKKIEINNLKFETYDFKNKISKFDLTLTALEMNEEIGFSLEYCTKLFKRETVEKLGNHFLNILREIVENEDVKISEIGILSEEEKRRILVDFNDTKVDYPKDKTIHELFEEQEEKTPNNIAVVFEDKKLTYRELNEKSNSLARVLREKGVKADSIVGIMVERSLEMIVGIMAILKAGGAYLPIDPGYPQDRIEYMLDDSNSNILLTQKHLVKKLKFDGIVVDLENKELYEGKKDNLENKSDSSNLAYVIYTSGSTGKPKGVMVEQKSLLNLILTLNKKYPCYKEDAYLLKTLFVFDVSISEIFGWYGGKLVISRSGDEKNPLKIKEYIDKYNITHINFVPSMLNVFLDTLGDEILFKKLKYVFAAGEALSRKTTLKFYKKVDNTLLVNLYGPTEATIYCNEYIVSKDKLDKIESIPIGKPLINYKSYIVDNNMKLLPINVSGELCIAGEGLARGYLNRPELTAEKFVANPYEPGEKMYRTGDLVRWLPDGNIEYLGRIDYQVKIRGFRIELGEIENQLLKNDEIKEAVVVDKEDKDGNKYLCAYIVCEKEITIQELRGDLSKVLPDYMIPSYFIQIEKMPLTLNGKIDRKALPEFDGDINIGVEYVSPRNEIEEKLVKVWSEILGVEKIGIDDDFFALGGESFKAIQVISMINKELNVEVPVSEVFSNPTVRQLGEYIGTARGSIYSSIKAVEEKEYYEASEAQKRIYMLQSFDKNSIAYNMPRAIEILGVLEANKVEEVFKKLIERHETLRTSFKVLYGNIIQKVHKIENVKFELEEIMVESEEELALKAREFIRPFNLEKAPLFRVAFIKLEKERQILLFDMHHINSDANSITILTEEFYMLYENKELEKLEVQYKDYSAWQNKIYNSSKMKMQEKYWLNKLQGDIPKLELPTDYQRGSMLDFNGDSYDFEIKEELLKRLREISKDEDVTLFTMIFSAYNILLSKVSNQEDITVGVPVNCRNHAQLEKVIGVFLNTIAIRNQCERYITFKEFLKRVNKNIVEGIDNQDYQFEMLIEKLNVSRELNRTPVFDTIMNFTSFQESSKFNNNKLKISPYDIGGDQAKFDITMYVHDLKDTVKISCNYRTELFKRETIEYLMTGFLKLLELISKDIEKSIKEYNIFSIKEIVPNKNRLVLSDLYNRFEKEEINQSVIERFEKQVDKYPDNIAVKTSKNDITYDLLNKRANKTSQSILKSMKVINNSCIGDNHIQTVALLCNHDIEMIVGMLGALKAGVIFVPLDPTYPRDRLIYMLKNSEAKVLISDESNIDLAETLKGQLGKNIAICKIDRDISNEKCNVKIKPEQIAYVMYTSGSTGDPKGVIQTNENILAFICGYTNELHISEKDKIILLSSYSHTTGIIDIFSALLNGATLCPYDIKSEGNMHYLAKWIEDEEITIYHSVPSIYRYYANCIKEHQNFKLRIIILGGECLYKSDVELYKKNFSDDCILVNLFGASEIIIATSYLINKETEIEKNIVSIGCPVDNVDIFIVDENGEEESVYGVGEIVYSSKYLAKGYWNLRDKTEEVFINNPITKEGIVYRSGDIGRILPNGRLEYLGRADYQVKIRGYRVEVSEVEHVLEKIEGIEKSVVIAYEKEIGENYLAAYYVVNDREEINLDSIKKELRNMLPSYMMPLCFKEIEEIPLTPNGKIDRKVLPRLDANINTGVEYVAPRNEIEEKLVELWKDILEVNKIGINDNFFDLGGQSLKATLLIGRIHEEFNVEITIKEIFKFSTVKEISEYINSKEKSVYERIEKLEVQDWYETASAQKRMYLMQELDTKSIAYNIPYVIEVVGKLELSRVKESFLKLIERHESLRTSFKLIDGRIMQKIDSYEDINFELEEIKLSDKNEINSYVKNFVRPFNLEKAPLIRVGIISVSEEKHIILYDVHHIVCDGTSMEILLTEFGKAYEEKELGNLDVQYKDYSAWQISKRESEAYKKQEEYWLNEFSGEIPVLNLPTDYIRPENKSFEGDSIEFVIEREVSNKLRSIAKETGSTMYMVLLSGVNILLSKYSDQEDIIVGTTIAGRNHRDLENIVGMFVNTLVIKSRVDSEITFKEYLNNVKEKTLKAYENQDYQFEELIEKAEIQRDVSRNPLFDVMFSLQNMEKGEVLINDLNLKQYIKGNTNSKFDISITAVELDGEIGVKFEYCTKLFKKQTIDKMINHFINIINEIASNRCVKLGDILMFNKDELEKIENDIRDSNHNIEFDF